VIFEIYISQGSVATQLRCGGIRSNQFITKLSTECADEKILKISQHLAKIWTKVCGLVFFGPPCCVLVYMFRTLYHHDFLATNE